MANWGSEAKTSGINNLPLNTSFFSINLAQQLLPKLFMDRGYVEGEQPLIYFREFTIEGRQYRVQVDLLAGEYEGTGKGHRT